MATRHDPPPYQQFDLVAGKYAIRRILGEGGMAVVYNAVDVTCDRQVAIKILRPAVAAKRALSNDLMMREASTAVKLHERTPHVVEVLTAGVTADAHRLPYVVMERLYGATLRAGIEDKRAKKQPFDILEIASTVTEIALPLAHAHAMGVAHRDIKPENVFLAEQRDSTYLVKLLDFGISALVDEDPAAALPRIFTGSRQYASPEQLDGRAVTQASDVYSLGLVLYEMLTFKLPHDRRNPTLSVAKAAHNVLVMSLGDFRDVRSDLPPRLEGLIEDCLEYRPERRPTALQVANRLRDVKGAFEHNLLGSEDVNATDVTGLPAEVLLQRLDNATGGATAPLRSFGAAEAVNLRASTQPPGAAATMGRGVNEEIFFDNRVAEGAGKVVRTDPMPQVFAPAVPTQPQRIVMVQGVTEVPPPPPTKPLPMSPPPPDATARLPVMSAAQAASAAAAMRPPSPAPLVVAPWPVTPGSTTNHSVEGFVSRTDPGPTVVTRRRGLRSEVVWLLLITSMAAMAVIAVAPGLLARRAARAAAAASATAALAAAVTSLPPPAPAPSSSAALSPAPSASMFR